MDKKLDDYSGEQEEEDGAGYWPRNKATLDPVPSLRFFFCFMFALLLFFLSVSDVAAHAKG